MNRNLLVSFASYTKNNFNFKTLSYIFLCLGIALGFWFLFYGGYFVGDWKHPSVDKSKEIHPFIVGLVTPLLTIGSTLLIIENLRTTTRQNFTTNFLKLLDQHHRLVENIVTWVEPFSSEEKPCKGRFFFDEICEKIFRDYEYILSENTTSNWDIDPELVNQGKSKNGKDLLIIIYSHYYHIYQSDLSHYFRNMFRIVKFVDQSNFRKKVKQDHCKILRAQLSNYEQLLLAYNGLHEYGSEFHPLIEEYRLLKTINSETQLPKGKQKRIVDLNILSDNYPHLKKAWLIE